jgi:hypothetical protein
VSLALDPARQRGADAVVCILGDQAEAFHRIWGVIDRMTAEGDGIRVGLGG